MADLPDLTLSPSLLASDLVARVNATEDRVAALEAGGGTSGTVTSVNGYLPDASGNVVVPTGGGGAGLTEDPDHPGLYFINQVQTVTPAAPTFTDEDGTASDRYTIPATTGVQYVVNGALRSAGIYTPTSGQTVSVVAQALPGYQLAGTTSWSFTFSTGTAPVEVTANTPTADDATDQITWTPKTGVEYVIGGTVRTPPYLVGDVDATVTVTAQAATGYVLSGASSWTFTFTKAPSTPFSDYVAAVEADSPAVFYKLNEASGATPLDTTGASTATVLGTVQLGGTPVLEGATSAVISTAATGANAITFGRPAALDGMTGFTAEAVIYATGAASGLLNRSDATTSPRFHLSYSGAPILTFARDGANLATTTGFAWNTPQHIAITHDGATLTFYVNGAAIHSTPDSWTLGSPAVDWEIGRQDSYQGGRSSLRGRISGVAFYNKVLSPARILAHAQAAGLAA